MKTGTGYNKFGIDFEEVSKNLDLIKKLLNETIKRRMRNVDVEVNVKGVMRVPVKLFNAVSIGVETSIPFETTTKYTYSFEVPLLPTI